MKSPELNDCGCCEGLNAETPAPSGNPSGLTAIAYRCGTHAQFKQSMLAALSSSGPDALHDLKTREDDDFSIALLDAWAITADVLTFYQERVATESYLRTATERVSLLQLARLIGYELRPGVAASASLAFTLEDTAGAPRSATIDIGTKVQSIPGPGEKAQTFETVEKIEARVEWNAIKARTTEPQQILAGQKHLYIDGISNQLQSGDAILIVGDERKNDALTSPNKERWDFRILRTVDSDPKAGRTLVAWDDGLGKRAIHPAQSNPKVYVFRQRTAFFGHNAPQPGVLADSTLKNFGFPVPLPPPAAAPPPPPPPPFTESTDWPFSINGKEIHLDGTFPKILPEGWLVLATKTTVEAFNIKSVATESKAGFALTSNSTRATLDSAENLDKFTLRETTIFAQSEELPLAEAPIDEPVEGTSMLLAAAVENFQAGRMLAVFGSELGEKEITSRLVKLMKPASGEDFARIEFTPALPPLERDSVTVNANIALATHGETVQEILGSGDASQSYQRFTLRQPPLTYVRAATASGAESTLQVRINDLLWHEVSTLVGHGPRDRVFVTRTDDDGKTTVQFGDGVTGARPPSGQENVRASYRKGIGLEGLVKAGELSMLMTRPLGVKGVTNPQNAGGAAARELLDDARRNAPVTVLTLDRIVSLQDYEDFVRAYAGIAKALAQWIWVDGTRGVFITVAGPGGAEIDMTGDFGRNLLGAIAKAAEPFVPVRIESYRKDAGLFTLTGKVKIDPDYEAGRVLAAVRAALESRFSFEARSFGEPLALSEVMAVMQAVPGIIAVVVDQFHPLEQKLERRRSGSSASPGSNRLYSRPAAGVPQARASQRILPAQLFRLPPISSEQIGVIP